MLGQVKDSAKPPRPLLAAVLLVGKKFCFFFHRGKKGWIGQELFVYCVQTHSRCWVIIYGVVIA